MMETKQGIWEKLFPVKCFTGKVGILSDQVFHQNPKLECFCNLF